MDYIVTTKNKNDIVSSSFLVVNTVKDLTEVSSTSFVVFDSSIDSPFDVVMSIIELVRVYQVDRIAYISEQPIKLIEEVMKSVKAYVVQEEGYLEDMNNLSELMTDIVEVKNSADKLEELSDSLEIVSGYLDSQLKTAGRGRQMQVLNAFKELVKVLDEELDSSELRDQLQDLILTFQNRETVYKRDIEKRDNDLKNLQTQLGADTSSLNAFQTFSYTGNSKILVIKEMTPVRYLTSYLWAFRGYMQDVKKVKTKLVIIERNSDMVDTRYAEKSLIKVEPSNLITKAGAINLATECYTTNPTRAVMTKITESIGVDLYIILDRTYKNLPVISARHLYKAYGVSSQRHARAFNLEVGSTIVNDQSLQGQLACLTAITGYKNDTPSRVMQQQSAFNKAMSDLALMCGYRD